MPADPSPVEPDIKMPLELCKEEDPILEPSSP